MSWLTKILSPILSVGGAATSVVGVATGQPWLAALGSQAGSLGVGLGQQNTNEALMQNQRYLQEDAQSYNAEQAQISRDFNAEQAQISRDFNAEQAQLQRDWSESMWMKQNEYNSPANQLKLMQEAGLNPNMFNQNVAGATTPSSGVSASSSPATSSMASIGAPSVPNLQNPELMMAQSRLLNAQADKAESDVDVNKATAQRVRSLLNGEIQIQNSTINLMAQQEKLSYAEAKKALASCRQLEQQTSNLMREWVLIGENISNLRLNNQLTQKEVDLYVDRISSEIAERLSNINFQKAGIVGIYANAEDARSRASLNREQQKLVAKQVVQQLLTNRSMELAIQFTEETQPSLIKFTNANNGKLTIDANLDAGGLFKFYPQVRSVMNTFSPVIQQGMKNASGVAGMLMVAP